MRALVRWTLAVALGAALTSVVSAQGTPIPEDGQRQPAPKRQAPPSRPAEQLLTPDDFADCYDAMGRPTLAVIAVLNIPHGQANVPDRSFVDNLSVDLGRRFSSNSRYRVVSAGRVATLREDAEYQRRVNANPAGAAQLTADELDADMVIILLCRPGQQFADLSFEYDCSFEIVDNRRGRQLGGRTFALKGPSTRLSQAERRQLVENTVKYTTNEIIGQLMGHCDDSPGEPNRRDGGFGAGVEQELTVRVLGDYENEDIRQIVREMRGLRAVTWVDPNPRVGTNPASIELDMEATKGGFDIGDDLAAGVYMAIGKDAQFVDAGATSVTLSVQDPVYSTWMGESNNRNQQARDRFRDLYREKGQPKVLVLVREVAGVTDRAVVTWYWHYAIVPAVEPEEAVAVRNAGGDAVRNAYGRVMRRSARLRPANATALGMQMQEAGIAPQGMNADAALFSTLRAMGIDYMVELKGRIDLQMDRDEPMRFTAALFNVQTAEELALTDEIGCAANAEDPVGGAECATEIGGRLAAQTLDMLRETWLDEPDWMKVVIADADTAREADRIQRAIEAVEGVDYVSFLALGDRGLVLEVAHFGADQDIRRALEQGDLPFELELAEGTTRSVLMLQLK